jgi:hypothetical protein
MVCWWRQPVPVLLTEHLIIHRAGHSRAILRRQDSLPEHEADRGCWTLSWCADGPTVSDSMTQMLWLHFHFEGYPYSSPNTDTNLDMLPSASSSTQSHPSPTGSATPTPMSGWTSAVPCLPHLALTTTTTVMATLTSLVIPVSNSRPMIKFAS